MGQNSQSATKMWEDPEYRQKVIENTAKGKSAPESKVKRSEATKKLWEDPAYRESVLGNKSPPCNKVKEEDLITKICPTCKVEFSVLPCRYKRVYCSKVCRTNDENRPKRKDLKSKPCESCSNIFVPGGARQVCCLVCTPTLRARRMWKAFKMNQSDWDKMMEDQKGKCPVCTTDLNSFPLERIHLDHCHTTGKVRSILCYGCNFLVGVVENRGHLLPATKDYIEAHRVRISEQNNT